MDVVDACNITNGYKSRAGVYCELNIKLKTGGCKGTAFVNLQKTTFRILRIQKRLVVTSYLDLNNAPVKPTSSLKAFEFIPVTTIFIKTLFYD